MYEVPDEVQANLLIPLLTTQAKSLVTRMSVKQMGVYTELKDFLLAEYKLRPESIKLGLKMLPSIQTKHTYCLLPGCVICLRTT